MFKLQLNAEVIYIQNYSLVHIHLVCLLDDVRICTNELSLLEWPGRSASASAKKGSVMAPSLACKTSTSTSYVLRPHPTYYPKIQCELEPELPEKFVKDLEALLSDI